MAGELPFFAKQAGIDAPGPAVVGLLLEVDGKRIAYTPSLAAIDAELFSLYSSCEAVLIDGTFWSDTELCDVQPGTPRARSIGHIPMSGEAGTLALLSDLRIPHKVFVHLNNTNPVLDARGPECRAVTDAGWQIGYDGWHLAL